jgi:hypothetical protein
MKAAKGHPTMTDRACRRLHVLKKLLSLSLRCAAWQKKFIKSILNS